MQASREYRHLPQPMGLLWSRWAPACCRGAEKAGSRRDPLPTAHIAMQDLEAGSGDLEAGSSQGSGSPRGSELFFVIGEPGEGEEEEEEPTELMLFYPGALVTRTRADSS